ncbi:enoyl-CoA hydratase/isomerase family protein [Labrys sp. KNU-23]|uniref:enoyl-CoA hydratase-related protein n=1 Tax=Labrys sp. KNU-23 TaxID=2789216 RepID=UPI0011EE1680|nr:enoyl-CoA hydratase-related protein [Labrys sp. KNU-23]QEN86736.1 enoyl-CoA hydratase/isomerase family protein [Labrys sp. KNU-23]
MSLRVERDGAVAVLTLDRPEVLNAFDEGLIAELTRAFAEAGTDAAVRAVLLRAEGKAFSAGADLAWMRRAADASPEDNLADARQLAELMRVVDTCPKPTLARVQGAAFGGAVGLVACCDIAIAVPQARFSLSEVRLGLIPGAISPYVVRAVGQRAARRLFLTAERFSAEDALRYGLIHEIAAPETLDETVQRCLSDILAGGPEAVAAAKKLAVDMAGPVTAERIEESARRIATIRSSTEAREGLAAFFAKRKPGWMS